MKKANTYLLYSGLSQMVLDDLKAPKLKSCGPHNYTFYEKLDRKLGLVEPIEERDISVKPLNEKTIKDIIKFRKYLHKNKKLLTEAKISKKFNISREQARCYKYYIWN